LLLTDSSVYQTKQSDLFQGTEDKRNEVLTGIQMIPANDLEKLREDPVATGSYANIYQYKWKKTIVAVKQPLIKLNSNQMNDIQLEAALCFNMKHSNIVALLGLTQLKNNYIGIVSEWSDLGNLRENMKKMNNENKTKVSLCICEGLGHMHLIGIAHLDMKPENVLLFGDKSKAKISDCGTSKVIQTIMSTNGVFRIPTYTAPELMEQNLQVEFSTCLANFLTTETHSLPIVCKIQEQCMCHFYLCTF
jgi:serine/threonine protein kinase